MGQLKRYSRGKHLMCILVTDKIEAGEISYAKIVSENELQSYSKKPLLRKQSLKFQNVSLNIHLCSHLV